MEVCKDVLNILNSGFLNKALNSTYIALIPKTKNPSYVNEFRPISLCNAHCKTVSKVLANRLKDVQPTVISPKQLAFIPYETLYTMHTCMWSKVGSLAIKLNMSNAYDIVE